MIEIEYSFVYFAVMNINKPQIMAHMQGHYRYFLEEPLCRLNYAWGTIAHFF